MKNIYKITNADLFLLFQGYSKLLLNLLFSFGNGTDYYEKCLTGLCKKCDVKPGCCRRQNLLG